MNLHSSRTRISSAPASLGQLWKLTEKIVFPQSYWVGKKLDDDLTPDNILLFPYDRGPRPLSQGMYHPRFVLDIVTGNPGTVRVANQNHYLEEGDALLIFPHQFNRAPHEPRHAAQGGWIVVTFELRSTDQIESLRNSPRRISTRERELLHALLKTWNEESSTLKLSLILSRLLLSLCEAPHAPGSKVQATLPINERDELLEKINQYIFKHLDKVSPQAGMAKNIGVTENQLRMAFSRLTGSSLGAYIRKQRLNEAARQLLVSKKNITQIAEIFGYSSVHAFSTSFKAVHGISPKQYEKISRNSQVTTGRPAF